MANAPCLDKYAKVFTSNLTAMVVKCHSEKSWPNNVYSQAYLPDQFFLGACQNEKYSD